MTSVSHTPFSIDVAGQTTRTRKVSCSYGPLVGDYPNDGQGWVLPVPVHAQWITSTVPSHSPRLWTLTARDYSGQQARDGDLPVVEWNTGHLRELGVDYVVSFPTRLKLAVLNANSFILARRSTQR